MKVCQQFSQLLEFRFAEYFFYTWENHIFFKPDVIL